MLNNADDLPFITVYAILKRSKVWICSERQDGLWQKEPFMGQS